MLKNLKKTREFLTAMNLKRALAYTGLFLLIYLALLALLSVDIVQTGRFNLGEVCFKDVVAPVNVEFINEKATEEARKRASAKVQVIYSLDAEASALVENKLREIFHLVRQKRDDYTQDSVKELHDKMPITLSDDSLYYLLSLSPSYLDELENLTRKTILKIMDPGIKQGELLQAQEKFNQEVLNLNCSSEGCKVISEIGEKLLTPNLLADWQKTAQLEQAAIAQVEPVETSIKKGQTVIRKGDIITSQHLEILKAMGMYRPRLNLETTLGNSLIVFLLMMLVIGLLRSSNKNELLSYRQILLTAFIVIIMLAAVKWTTRSSPYLAPVAAAAMLIAILQDFYLAIIATIVMSCFVGFFTGNYTATLVTLFTGIFAVYTTKRVERRWDLFIATSGVILANVVAVLAMELSQNSSLEKMAVSVSLAGLNGLACGIIAIGALPLLENVFSITTQFKLLELSNPAEPLLQKLMMEAPGTYHHSLIIANLAEAAARRINANPLMARVGALYHDLGKTKRPFFFVENQMGGDNPHDKLSPHLSALIIAAHVKDGMDLSQQYNLPEAIREVIEQHHGNSLIRYFYHQAKTLEGDEIDDSGFRYHHLKPKSKEAALILLADICEASARALPSHTPTKIENSVHDVIKECLDDGQLQDSELSFRDISIINIVYSKMLTSLYHSRVEYPDAGKDGGKTSEKKG